MTARVTTTTEVVPSPPPGLSTPSGQAFILGVTQKGPVSQAVKVTGLADYRAVFGDRAGGTAMYDTVEMAFKEGLAQAWIVRLAGPAALAASKSVGTLTVTATSPGAWGNSITAGWTNASKTLTVDGVGYPCSDLASLQAALKLGAAPVTVTGTLPTSDVASGALSSGTDDNANAVLSDRLALFNASLGDGAVTIVGKSASVVSSALASHCQATNRLGLVPAASGSTLSAALTELLTLTDPSLTMLWPDITAGSKQYTLVGLALGARARAHASGNPVASPIAAKYGTARFATGVLTDITDAEWNTANAAGLSIARVFNGQVRLFGWRSVAAPGGALTLQGANYRDLMCRVAAGCQQIADEFAGETIDGKGLALSAFAGRLVGFLESIKTSFAAGANDPGYLVDVGPGVNPPSQIANGLIKANVSFRAAGTAEFITIAVVATDAAGTL